MVTFANMPIPLTGAWFCRKAELFSDFTQGLGQEPLQLIDIGAGTLPNSRYYKASIVRSVTAAVPCISDCRLTPDRSLQPTPCPESTAFLHVGPLLPCGGVAETHAVRRLLVMQGCQVTAVDPNRSMEAYVRENAATHGLQGFEAVEGLAEQLPFSDASFDRAVCTLVLSPHPSI